MANLTCSTVFNRIRHGLMGEQMSADLDPLGVLNRAGNQLHAWHSWKFVEEIGRVSTRAKTTLTGASWTEATKTLTKIGAFTSYEFLEGDNLSVSAGTAVLPIADSLGAREHRITARVSNDAITVATSIVSDASNPTDVDGFILAEGAALPPDFDRLSAYEATQSLNNSLVMTSWRDILLKRTSSVALPSNHFWGALRTATPTAGGRPVPRMELYPVPETAEGAVFTIVYPRAWIPVTGNEDPISIPEFCDTLYLELAMAYARGYEQDTKGLELEDRLAKLRGGSIFRTAVQEDGEIQPDYGPIINGASGGRHVWVDWADSATVIHA